jgi:hypothetical protein
MRHFQEWYTEKGRDKGEWVITQAMKTIAHAHPVGKVAASETAPVPASKRQPADPAEEGRVTWLLDLVDGKPRVETACPFHGAIPGTLQGKDWTRYAGLLHTDHNVRTEFFEDRRSRSPV